MLLDYKRNISGNYNSYVHETPAESFSSAAPPGVTEVQMPRFRSENNNVTVFTFTGANTHIDCAVEHLGPDTVISWVRRRDLHILTIATITYTADRRLVLFNIIITNQCTNQV